MTTPFLKRLMKELKSYNASPLANTAAVPREGAMNVWDCTIMLEFPATGIRAPMHLVVVFTEEYPIRAPQVHTHIHTYTHAHI